MTTHCAEHEERANAASHALGALGAAAALPLLAGWAGAVPPGAAVFGGCMLAVYLASALYHALPAGGRAKLLARRLDHAAIFLFIAGSYTPFALRDLGGGAGGLLLGGVWAAAALGMALKLLGRLAAKGWSTAVYLAFGWAVVALAQPLVAQLSPTGQQLLLAGGLAYSVGTVFFLLDRRLRWGHLVWHVFVLAGSGCHLAAMLLQ